MTPDQHTSQEFFLDVGDGHQLYVQDWGKKDASIPILFLHGGPGASVSDRHKQRFDPVRQRVIFFDQRGAGKSLPKGSIEHNTTKHLIADIETLADHLLMKKFIVTGGSWGSCLALGYALEHPSRIHAMVLSGIYTASRRETDYLDQGGFRNHFPEVWERYTDRAPKEYADNPSEYHYKQAFGKDPEAAKKSIYAYSEMEGSLLFLDDRRTPMEYDTFDPDDMKIELHYLKHGCFMPDRYILKNAHALTMPIWLVQGRYDMVCPPITAYELSKKLPNGQLLWTMAGHGNDRPNYDVMRTLLLQLTA
jgi:proline iminopeptidase